MKTQHDWRSNRLGYRPSLDGIRALAVLGVLAFHNGTRLKGGFIGVDMFFVLSGFLITTLLLEERQRQGRIRLSGFYRRRARRLLPALFLMLALALLLETIRPALARGIGFPLAAFAIIGYVGNWVEAFHPGSPLGILLGHTWSLAVEEQFYFAWPILLIVLLKRKWSPARLLGTLLLFAVASSTLRALLWFSTPHLGATRAFAYPRTDIRIDELAIGCALSIVFASSFWRGAPLQRWLSSTALPVAAATILLGLSATLSIDGRAYYLGGLTLVALSTAVIIAHTLANPKGIVTRALAWRPLVWVGERSYGIYLFHPLVFVGVFQTLPWTSATGIPALVIRIGVTFVVAALSYRYVESRFRSSRKRPTEAERTGDPATADATVVAAPVT